MASPDVAFSPYVDLSGNPLDNGFVYFGQVGQNPLTSPVTVYWDQACTQPASQPIRTLSGFPSRNGVPAPVYAIGDYSRLVNDAKGRQVIYQPAVSGLSGSSGASVVGFVQAGVGAVSRTVEAELRDTVSAKQFGAVGDGAADDTAAINKALATGKSVRASKGTFRITGTLSFVADGQVLYGDGKDGQTVITNTTTAAPLFTFSTGAGNVSRKRCGIAELSFVGNALTTEGVALRGIVDDGLTADADKSCWMRNVRIKDVGAGFGLRVSSWANTFSGVEIWTCNKGLKCGAEFNANTFSGLYISNCTNEGISSPVSAGQPAVNTFVGAVVQYCGGANASIDIQEGYAYNFQGLYLEGNTSPCNLLFAAGAHGCTASGVMHNLVTGTVGIQVVRNEGKGNSVLGAINLGGTIDSLVRIEGTLPTTTVSALHMSAGTATNGALNDLSTRKATVWLDGLTGRQGPTAIRALTSQNALELRDSATDTLQAFWQNGGLYFGTDATVPALSRSGGTLSMTYSAGVGTFRAPQFGLGATGGPLWVTTPGSPEGAITAPQGSLCSRTAGGAGTTLYVKETGAGNTGWVAK